MFLARYDLFGAEYDVYKVCAKTSGKRFFHNRKQLFAFLDRAERHLLVKLGGDFAVFADNAAAYAENIVFIGAESPSDFAQFFICHNFLFSCLMFYICYYSISGQKNQ